MKKKIPSFLSPKLLEELSFTDNNEFDSSWSDKIEQLDVLPLVSSIEKEKQKFEINSLDFSSIPPDDIQILNHNNNKFILWYELDLELSTSAGAVIKVHKEDLVKGKFTKLDNFIDFDNNESRMLYGQKDLDILQLLLLYSCFDEDDFSYNITLPSYLLDNVFCELSKTKRLFVYSDKYNLQKRAKKILNFKKNNFSFKVTISSESNSSSDLVRWKIWGNLSTQEHEINLWDVSHLYSCGILLYKNELVPFDPCSYYTFLKMFLDNGPLYIEKDEIGLFLYKVLNKFGECEFDLPLNINLNKKVVDPRPVLYLTTKNKNFTLSDKIQGQIWFKYAEKEFPALCHKENRPGSIIKYEMHSSSEATIDDLQEVNLFYPNLEMEDSFRSEIEKFQKVSFSYSLKVFNFHSLVLLDSIYKFMRGGWEIWAENVQVKIIDQFVINISSELEWFDLSLTVKGALSSIDGFQLIHMLKKNSLFIKLGDGRLGVIPEMWFEQLKKLSSLGVADEDDDKWKFSSLNISQLNELEVLTKKDNEEEKNRNIIFDADEKYYKIRDLLRNIKGLPIKEVSKTFTATLRSYQEYGLSWLHFLDDFHFGGLLADDMGLGKTLQVLAFLENKRVESQVDAFVTLLILPKSLIDNWTAEVRTYCPGLLVKILTSKNLSNIEIYKKQFDILIITYGLVQYNNEKLQEFQFDLIVLDEAQQIKNRYTLISKAVKSLSSKNRLAISGTPIENHVGELISIFEFLNPYSFDISLYNRDTSSKSEHLESFMKGVRPLILRRLKNKVAKDLPEKTIQTVFLPLEHKQQQYYNEVKKYFSDLLKKGKGELQGNKVMFFEGLLRLRQIACHPDLIFKSKNIDLGTPSQNNIENLNLNLNQGHEQENLSSKVRFLMEKVELFKETDHKVLIFSQFTSFLKIIRKKFEDQDIQFEYLDGETINRVEVVNNFQEKPEIHFFLLSLKAGGVGLNLTAADYCFMLDTWWNPAVEQQAIDRTHRIGQKRPVTVYRLLGKGTVEEKIQELHKIKLEQANYLEYSDNEFLKRLDFDDFTYLFS